MTKYSPVQRFWLMLKPDKLEIRNVYLYAIFNGLVNLSLPLGIQSIINLIQGGKISTSWIVLVVLVVLGIAITGFLQIAQLRIAENLQQKIFARAAFDFTFRIPKIKQKEIYNQYAPELMNRFFDIISVQKGLSKILLGFSTAAIQGIFGLILLSMYHPFFIIFSFALLGLMYLMFKTTMHKGLETSLKESKFKYNVAHWLQEVARTGTTFKLAGSTDLPLEKTNSHTENYIDARESHFKILKQQYTFLTIFKMVIAAGLLAIGSILVMEQKMNIGQFVASEIIILLVLSSVEKVIFSLETIYDVLTSLEKIGQVTDLEIETSHGRKVSEECLERGIEVNFQNVTFSYPEAPLPAFSNINLNVKAGEKLLIQGENSSGKSTLLYLLAGIYIPQSGSISYNDIPSGNVCLEDLRANIGDCLMDEQLFEGTILENITMGREKASFENVKWAVKNLGLEDFVKNLPEGYDTKILPQGKQYSQGTINKLILARCIADRPKLLLIKDAFSSIQHDERKKIIDFILNENHGWTVVIASTDIYLASRISNKVILKEGNIIEK